MIGTKLTLTKPGVGRMRGGSGVRVGAQSVRYAQPPPPQGRFVELRTLQVGDRNLTHNLFRQLYEVYHKDAQGKVKSGVEVWGIVNDHTEGKYVVYTLHGHLYKFKADSKDSYPQLFLGGGN